MLQKVFLGVRIPPPPPFKATFLGGFFSAFQPYLYVFY
uniref:Uncharacterized protein n=1 Tax=Siphoviridae sp. ctCsv15 TaxID=2826195 RepID=A0A8S5LZF5_9CAUD|nr:MAG TPA: hypothetical protein [Siphoviridae sp. ctCsv15]